MNSKTHLGFIDALRGFAALYVLFYHTALIPNPPLKVPEWGKDFFLNGGMGVTLFFVISAFTLTMSIRQREQETKLYIKFYIRRAFRILPLFYVWLAASIFRDYHIFQQQHSLKVISLNIFFLFNFSPNYVAGIVWASWTLGVEMLFYLLFPLIYQYTNNIIKSLTFFVITVTISTTFGRILGYYVATNMPPYNSFLQFSILNQLPVFAMGIFIYFIYERWIKNNLIPKETSVLLLTSSLLLFAALVQERLNFLFSPLYWQAIIFSLLVLGLAMEPWKLLINPITQYLGKISYSLYLNHPTLVLLLIPVYRKIYETHSPITFQYGSCVLITLVLLVILATITYYAIENPGMRAGNWLIKRL